MNKNNVKDFMAGLQHEMNQQQDDGDMLTHYTKDGHDWPLTIDVEGKELKLQLLDAQTGDYCSPEQIGKLGFFSSDSWLQVVYMDV